jgi:ribulose-5-phosphate 4-epimerase/fuculose-1-phosphate aldolase
MWPKSHVNEPLDWLIHGEIYKLRPDVNGVVHTHSMGVIPFGVTQVPLKPVVHTCVYRKPKPADNGDGARQGSRGI